MREDKFSYEGQGRCTMATCTGWKKEVYACAQAAVTTLCKLPSSCPGTLPRWLRVDWLSRKTLQAMSA